MVEESADKSYELCIINIHESISTCLWKTTLVCLSMSYGGVTDVAYSKRPLLIITKVQLRLHEPVNYIFVFLPAEAGKSNMRVRTK